MNSQTIHYKVIRYLRSEILPFYERGKPDSQQLKREMAYLVLEKARHLDGMTGFELQVLYDLLIGMLMKIRYHEHEDTTIKERAESILFQAKWMMKQQSNNKNLSHRLTTLHHYINLIKQPLQSSREKEDVEYLEQLFQSEKEDRLRMNIPPVQMSNQSSWNEETNVFSLPQNISDREELRNPQPLYGSIEERSSEDRAQNMVSFGQSPNQIL